MAISKNDCILLLGELKNSGCDTDAVLKKLLTNSNEGLIEAIKFINDNRQLDVTDFYTKVRKSYNNKKSKLYINIVKEIDDPTEVLTTLSALETQILLFARTAADRQMFLSHARAQEVSAVLNNYFKTYDITSCVKLLQLIKADIKALEYCMGRKI